MKLLRKITHIITGTLIALSIIFLYDDNKEHITLALGVITLFGFSMDFLRTAIPQLNKFLTGKPFNILLYDDEKKGINSATLFFFSSLICVMFFGKISSVVGISVLTYADSLASIIGYKFGRIKINDKSLEGSITFFIVSFVICILFFPVWKVIIISLVVSVVELLSVNTDDNLTIPLTTVFLISILGGV